MKHAWVLLSAFIMALLLSAPVSAQFMDHTPQERVLLGVHGGMAFSWHQGSFTTGDAQFDCCTFSGGNGIGRVVGLRGVLPLSSVGASVKLRIMAQTLLDCAET